MHLDGTTRRLHQSSRGGSRCTCRGRASSSGPGESFFAPRGIAHVYRVESDEARWLGVGNPAGFADFVREASDVATAGGYPPADREPDIARVAEAAARYGIELLGPPGTLPA